MTEALRGAVLRTHGKHCIWVQSPNQKWMLLSGFWPSRKEAVKAIVRYGYLEMAPMEALAIIEKQMQDRMLEITNHNVIH